MQTNNIDPVKGFESLFSDLIGRVRSLETRPTGTVFVPSDQKIYTEDPATGVQTHFGLLPDGTIGLQQFIGDTTPPPVPSAPAATSELGTATVIWNGSFAPSGGVSQYAPADFSHLNAYSQNVTGGQVYLGGSLRSINDSVIFSGIFTTGDQWNFWLTSLDVNGNESIPSTITGPITIASVLDDTGLAATLANNQTQIDANSASITANNTAIAAKSSVYSQSTAPTGAHSGDYWLDSSNGNKAMYYNGSAWVSVQDSAIGQALTTANGKNTIVSASTAPTGTHATGDVWFDTSNGNRPNTWNGTAWVSAQDASIATAQSAANSALSTANGKNTIISAASAPATAGHINGDIWFDTAHGNKPMVFSTNAWVSAQDASIATAQTAATNAQTSANGKNTIKYSSSVASGSGTATGDVWFQTNSSGNVIGQWQWSGSAWVQQVIDNSLIAANIDAGKITTGYIAAGRIQAGTITASMIATDTITAGNIAAGAITASELAAGSVTAVALSANSVSATAMVANTITAGQIAAGTITTNEIKANTITASNIAANTITASQIAANTVTAGQIAAGTITSTQIKASTITASNIAASTITASQIAGGTITATQIAVGTITSANIAASAITANKISAGAIDGILITGATIQTAVSGARVVMDSTGLRAYNASSSQYLTVNSSGLNAQGTFSNTIVDDHGNTLTISMTAIHPNVGTYQTAGVSFDSTARTDGVPPTVYSNDGSALFLSSGSNGSTRRGSSVSITDNGVISFDATTVDFSGGGASADLIDINHINGYDYSKGTANTPYILLVKTTIDTMTAANTFYDLHWDAVVDSNLMTHSNTTNNHQITIQKAGIYTYYFKAAINNTTGVVSGAISVNGTTRTDSIMRVGNNSGAFEKAFLQQQIRLNVGDVITIQASSGTAGSGADSVNTAGLYMNYAT